eukprot:GEMP01064536.1.p2 GENE.GEMP01064536.1~~GEMP01064536.1.p2  ORF type:complete len:100 (+),score=6.41 GEMP01064536.1:186-485(+)
MPNIGFKLTQERIENMVTLIALNNCIGFVYCMMCCSVSRCIRVALEWRMYCELHRVVVDRELHCHSTEMVSECGLRQLGFFGTRVRISSKRTDSGCKAI